MSASVSPTHFNNYNAYLRLRFGGRVAKVSLDMGQPCPHRREHPPGCIYCRPGVIMNDQIGSLGSIRDQIDAGVMAMGQRYQTDIFLGYFQNETNTAGNHEWLRERYDEAFTHPKVKGVVISTRPDYLDDALLDMLCIRAWRKPVFFELGLQSAHDETLARINRGHSFDDFARAVARIHARRLPVAAHVILGLPGETPEMMVQTFRALATLPLDSLKIHHLQIYPKSPLEAAYLRGEIALFESFDDYLPVLLDCLEVLPWRIKIQRLVADAPRTLLIAPGWDENKNTIIQRVEEGFAARGTRQGAKADPAAEKLALI